MTEFWSKRLNNLSSLMSQQETVKLLLLSRNSIAQITLNNFASDNANTLESKKTWLAKLAKTKESKRREMPQ